MDWMTLTAIILHDIAGKKTSKTIAHQVIDRRIFYMPD